MKMSLVLHCHITILLKLRGVHAFQKSRSDFEILGIRNVTLRKFHTENS